MTAALPDRAGNNDCTDGLPSDSPAIKWILYFSFQSQLPLFRTCQRLSNSCPGFTSVPSGMVMSLSKDKVSVQSTERVGVETGVGVMVGTGATVGGIKLLPPLVVFAREQDTAINPGTKKSRRNLYQYCFDTCVDFIRQMNCLQSLRMVKASLRLTPVHGRRVRSLCTTHHSDAKSPWHFPCLDPGEYLHKRRRLPAWL